jgi:hypothetical protein
MSLYDVKKIQISSIFKVFPWVFAILGAVIGMITFFIAPTEVAAGLSFGSRLVSWLIFVIIYSVVMVIGMVLVIWLYNVVVKKLGCGIVISLENK